MFPDVSEGLAKGHLQRGDVVSGLKGTYSRAQEAAGTMAMVGFGLCFSLQLWEAATYFVTHHASALGMGPGRSVTRSSTLVHHQCTGAQMTSPACSPNLTGHTRQWLASPLMTHWSFALHPAPCSWPVVPPPASSAHGRCLPWWPANGTCVTTSSLAGRGPTSLLLSCWCKWANARRRHATWPGQGCGLLGDWTQSGFGSMH